MITSSISISTTELLQLQKHIRMEVLTNLQRRLTRAIPYIKIALQDEILKRVRDSDLLTELQTGKLRLHLGLTHDEVVNMSNLIPDVVSKATNVRLHKTNDSINVIVEMISRGYEDLLALPQASYLQTYTTKEPVEIPWLSWLLTKGDTIVVSEFRVKYTDNNINSRSGGAIMVRGPGFRVSPQWSGTEDRNFITKTLENIDDFIYREIVRYL